MADPKKLSLADFGAKIKLTHPEYHDMDDSELAQRILAKHPQYADMVEPPATAPSTGMQMGREAALGFAGQFVPLSRNASDYSLIPGAAQIASHPLDSAGLVGSSMIQGNADMLEKAKNELMAPGFANKATGLIHGLGGMIPLIGPAAVSAGESIGSGDKVEAANGVGSALGLILSLGLGTKKGAAISDAAIQKVGGGVQRGVSKLIPGTPLTPEVAAVKAARPTNVKNFTNAFKVSHPDIVAASQTHGIPLDSLDNVLAATDKAKQGLLGEFNQKLSANGTHEVETSPVADAIEATVDPRFREQFPQQAQAVLDIADKYRNVRDPKTNAVIGPRKMNLQDIDKYIQLANQELRQSNFYGKSGAGQYAAQAGADTARTVAEVGGLRDLFNTTLDTVSNQPGTQALKGRIGKLTQLQQDLAKRQNVYSRNAPETLQETMNIPQGAGNIIQAVADGHIGTAVRGVAQMATSRYLANRANPNFLLEKAYNGYNAPPSVMNPQFGGSVPNPLIGFPLGTAITGENDQE